MVAAATLALCCSAAACGSDGDSEGDTTTTAAAASTSSTTTAAVAAADADTVALAKSGVLDPGDLGPGWAVDSPAKEGALADLSCAGPIGPLPAGSYQVGATVHRENTKWFVTSSAVAFPDDAAAVKWIEYRRSPVWLECRRADLEKEQKAGNPKLSVAVAQTTADGVGSDGLEAFNSFTLRFDDNGTVRDANGSFNRTVYRVGRTVVLVNLDIVSSETDPATLNDEVSNQIQAAVVKAYDRLG